MLSTFHLRTFLAVVDTGNYSAAAAALHMTQPAVSQQIRALEEQLGGIRLFRRVGQRMVLTHAGEELLASARELVRLAERAEETLMALKGQVAGRVVLGCTPGGGERLLPRLLAGFHEQFPGVGLELVVASTEALLDGLANRSLNLALLQEPQRRRGLESTLLATEPLILAAPAGHPLLRQEQLPPATLCEHPLILPRSGTALRRAIEDLLRRRGVNVADLRPCLETDSATAQLQAVRAGLGLAFLPRSCAPIRGEGVGHVDLAGASLNLGWFIVRVRERSGPGPAQSLFTFLTGSPGRAIIARAGLQPASGEAERQALPVHADGA
ncbi:MAG: LysR family transcriptional regulator [Oscillochloridaceae bacterium]|nr:LysR family transcriptional regulator [Chloroflexaceae bacterium]MDW8391598.1 LysR family transcriptional regulator [Oscillochloridaceae bacterium]